ncbi:hypothetical protein [Geoglobus sp.]
MLRVTIAVLLAMIMVMPIATAWEISEVRYNATEGVMKVCLELNPIERLISFFVGGEYTRNLVEDIITGNYTFEYVGYDCSYITLNGSVQFSRPVSIVVENGNETWIFQNVTVFQPLNLGAEKVD